MFADRARIFIRSGKGGDGHVSFRRELYVPDGGPDGGDGGKGGDLIFVVDPGLNTLVDYRHKRKYCAGDGKEGSKKKCTGASGEDMILKVPAGTVVKDAETGKVILDMANRTEPVVLLKGGRGGKGNQHYATATMQAPCLLYTSHLGMKIIYDQMNRRDDIYCERVFSPWVDLDKVMREENIPLFALESQDPVFMFDFLAITIQYEMCYTNILQVLDLSQIGIYAKDRREDAPFVIGGGPCTYNPEPLADFFDMFYIGESETVYYDLMDLYKEHKQNGCLLYTSYFSLL